MRKRYVVDVREGVASGPFRKFVDLEKYCEQQNRGLTRNCKPITPFIAITREQLTDEQRAILIRIIRKHGR